MGIFSKRRSENIDFVELAKRGVLDSVREHDAGIPMGSDGMIDFTSGASVGTSSSSVSSSSSSSSGGMMGFLDNLAGASETESIAAPAPSNAPVSFWDDVPGAPTTVSSPSSGVDVAEESSAGPHHQRMTSDHLQTKLEDLEYKMERLMEKLSRLEEDFRR